MFELGERSEEEHRNIGKLLEELTKNNIYTAVLFCGKNMKYAAEEVKVKKSYYFEDKKKLQKFLIKAGFKNAFFLLKASRGMELEKIIDCL